MKNRLLFVLCSAVALLVFAGGAGALPDGAAAPAKAFFRIRRSSANVPLTLDTAVGRYQGNVFGHQVTVDLVAAIHVAEHEYYARMNKDFEQYDAVLYELIAPEDRLVPPPAEARPSNVLSSMQGMIKTLLALEFQLDGINYGAKNFVHADLSPDEFMKAMSNRGESVWSILARLLAHDLFPEDKGTDPAKDLKILFALLSSDEKNRAYRMRRYLADDFGQVEDLVARIEGPSGSALIADRNARAIEVLAEQIQKGRKKLAIFYGGAHMPDMEKRLLEKFPLSRTDLSWRVAWRLQPE